MDSDNFLRTSNLRSRKQVLRVRNGDETSNEHDSGSRQQLSSSVISAPEPIPRARQGVKRKDPSNKENTTTFCTPSSSDAKGSKSRAEYFRNRRKNETPDQKKRRLECLKNNNQRQSQPRKTALEALPEDLPGPSGSESENLTPRQVRWINTTPEVRQQNNVRRLLLQPPTRNAAVNMFAEPEKHDLGMLTNPCPECDALHFINEKTSRTGYSSCCASGTVTLSQPNEYPNQWKQWLLGTDETCKNFRINVRKYNSAVAFASFGYQPAKLHGGPPVFVIHGQVYHKTSTSVTSTNQPKYAQLYVLDPEFATNERMTNPNNKECLPFVMEQLDSFLRQNNPYARKFMMMAEVLRRQEKQVDIRMWITKEQTPDPRRYNLPVATEIAVVFESEDGEPPANRDLCVHSRRDGSLQNIPFYSPRCDPMTYPILFPYGDPGWQNDIPKSGKNVSTADETDAEGSGRTVSMLQFYSYRLQQRRYFNPLLHAGKLTQQYVVDAFLKVEAQRLQYNEQNQGRLRVDLYMGLMDYVHTQAEQRDLKAGRIVILPSSFNGGKRAMAQNYQDAMAIVAKYGKPDYFITFTCNPAWTEITTSLNPNETAIDRPDIVATVFRLKLNEFLNDMTYKQGGVLGKVKAFITVIEFQKRGLPHCHMLFIMDEDDKLREKEQVDAVISAELPEQGTRLFDIVKSCMIHGPCGEHNQGAPCMEDIKGVRTCSKGFPKNFQHDTNVNIDGYPHYRRRNDGNTVLVRSKLIDNRWVVPYNPFLSLKYDAHINVECCSSVKSVKYIFKYVYKGHDAAIVKISENDGSGRYDWDEVQTYKDTRYIAAPEAMWRIRKYDMYKRSHSIERLPVHLPAQQPVVFEHGNEENALKAAEKRGTKLTKYFELNASDPAACELFYNEIPYHYTWSKNQWKPRQRGADKIIPRIYSVSPKDMERFSLKLLLLHVKGAKSFEDLRTVDGVSCETFKEAALRLQLLKSDDDWYKTLDEATVFQMPAQLRMLLAMILIHGDLTDARQLYQKYRLDLIEDYIQSHSEYMAEQLALRDLEEHLQQFGKRCQHFLLPAPDPLAYELDEEQNQYDSIGEFKRLASTMNTEQRTAFDIIINSVEGRDSRKCFFLSGAGGCGKTYVYKALTAYVTSKGGKVKAVAPTGLAATLLINGKTVHSGFGLPLDLTGCSVSRFTQLCKEYKELLETKLIIWDEISMCHHYMLEAVDRSLRELLNVNKPFGGITIVVGGDFRQQAPVVIHGNRVKIVEACAKSSGLWKQFSELKLIQNMRVQDNEAEFSNWLLKIGAGISDREDSLVKIPTDCLTQNLVTSVFGDDINDLTHSQLAARAILCPKNADTADINAEILTRLKGEPKTYYSIDEVGDCQSEEERINYPVEFLHSLTPMGMPPHMLKLKKGCCVMLLRNLNPKFGLCNGTRLIVETLGVNMIECSIFTGSRRGQKVFIPRVNLDCKCDLPFVLKRRQFPIRLAYSMTITKSQGQTFEKIGVNLPEPVFTHGQLYTAFSRVKSKSGLFVSVKNSSKQGKIFDGDDNVYTYNCVYNEIL